MNGVRRNGLSARQVARSALTRSLRAGLLHRGAALATASRAEGGKGGGLPPGRSFPTSARAQGKLDRTPGFGPAARASGK